MPQSDKCCEQQYREKAEPVCNHEIMVNGVTVYESFRTNGSNLWECLLQSMGKL